jgi:hypothetical protein
MEIYHIYLQLPDNIRIVIDVLLLVLALLLFYLPFAVIGTNRHLAKLLESNKQVEDNTHQMLITLNKLSLDLDDSEPDDQAFYEETESKDPTESKDENPRSVITCRECYQLNKVGTQTCAQCGTWL